MLLKMRSWMNGSGAYIFVGIIIAAFGLSGVGSIFSTIGSTAIISSAGQSIDRHEFEYRLDFEEQEYNRNYGRPVTPEIRRRLAARLIDQQSLRLVIDNVASDIDLDFSATLTGSSHTERTQGLQDLKRDFIYSTVAKSLTPPSIADAFVKRLIDEKRDVSYIRLNRSMIEDDFSPDEVELKSGYDDDIERFKIGESRSVALIEISPSVLRKRVELSDEDKQAVKDDYKATAQTFDSPERRELWQFNFNTKSEAEKGRQRLAEEKVHVDELAKELGLKRDGYEIGAVSREDVVIDAIGDIAFSLNTGDVSDVITNGLSYSVIKVGEITPKVKRPKKEVMRIITDRLEAEKAESLVDEVYAEADDLLISGKLLEEIAETLDLELKTYDTVFADSTTTDGRSIYIPGGQELVDEIFETDVNVENPAFEWQNRGYIIYEVRNIKDGYQQTFEEVKDTLKAELIDEHISTALQEKAKTLIEAIEAGEAFEDVAKRLNLPLSSVKDITRQSGGGFRRKELEALFSTQVGRVVEFRREFGIDRFVARIDRAYVPDFETARFEQGQSALKQTLGQTAWRALYKHFEAAYPVEINQSAVDEILTRLDENSSLL